jgi:hypothetical protein
MVGMALSPSGQRGLQRSRDLYIYLFLYFILFKIEKVWGEIESAIPSKLSGVAKCQLEAVIVETMKR